MYNPVIGNAASLSELRGFERLDPKNPANGERESLSFGQFVDAVNPLQHIPVVSAVYRHFTGDEIDAPSRIMGGALYGGPLGMAFAMGDTALEQESGRDVNAHVMAQLFGGEDEAAPQQAPETRFAESAPAVQPSAEAASRTANPDALNNAMAVGASLQRIGGQATPQAGAANEAPGHQSAPASTANAEPAGAPSSASGTLTGNAALAALAADLGGSQGRAQAQASERGSPRDSQLASAAARPEPGGPGENARFMPIERQHYSTSPALRARAAAQRAEAEAAQQDIRNGDGTKHASHPSLSAALVNAQEQAQRAYNAMEETAQARETRRTAPAGEDGGIAQAPEPAPADTMPSEDFTSRMMEALDKYRAMQQ